MKKKPRRKKPKKRMFNKILIGVVAVAAILGLGYLIYSISRQAPPFQYKAAIIDHLSHPEWGTVNQTFIDASTAILEKAGFSVDYYDWKNVTVNFYRNLPTHGYGLIVLRVHSAAGIIGEEQSLALFTSELYSNTGYQFEQVQDRVVRVSLVKDVGPYYFGVSPKFISYSMKGRFANTIIIMMGCDGLNTNTIKMAEAFVEKGASVYVSWDRHVTAAHTDQATTYLLQRLVAENETIRNSVEETKDKVGPDPQYKSELSYYPDKAGDLTIPKIAGILALNLTKTVSCTNKIRKFRLDG